MQEKALKIINEEQAVIKIQEVFFTVCNHWFWPEFVNEWEIEAWIFYKNFCLKNSVVLDIGSWIGPTALIAVANGASKVFLVEANPTTIDELKKTKNYDPQLNKKWELIEGCLSNKEGMIEFGTPTGTQASSSASSVRGKGYKVQTLKYEELIFHVGSPSIIKIDIEGSEIDILDDIIKKSPISSAVWLSWHPPFWIDKKPNIYIIEEMFNRYHVLDSEFNIMSVEKFLGRITSLEVFPAWGTAYGNFFETALLNKKVFDINYIKNISF